MKSRTSERLHSVLERPSVRGVDGTRHGAHGSIPPGLLHTAGYQRSQRWRQRRSAQVLLLPLPSDAVDEAVEETVKIQTSQVLPRDVDTSSWQREVKIQNFARTVVLQQ